MNSLDLSMEFIVQNLADLSIIAKDILANLNHNVVLLQGELGAGKTSLVKEFLSILNPDEDVTSPTFSLVNEYKLENDLIYHLDLYRIESIEEALDMGIEDYLNDGKFVFLEWPTIIMPLIPENHHLIEIEALEDASRRINLS